MKIKNYVVLLTLCISYQNLSHSMRDSAHLYAPWRETYSNLGIDGKHSSKCAMCRISSKSAQAQDFVLLQSKHFVLALNAFPYSRGHLLLIPRAHIESVHELHANARLELIEIMADATALVQKIFNCPGLNVGYNQGYKSGASIPDHLHIHIVPRYENHVDSFIDSISKTRVVGWDLSQQYYKILPHFAALQKKYS